MMSAALPACLLALRNFHLNGLVRVSGVVTRRTGVFPQMRVSEE
jgi:DNA replicative helicase MCM subunit Mcm2 (Cdc46/Mcm family)